VEGIDDATHGLSNRIVHAQIGRAIKTRQHLPLLEARGCEASTALSDNEDDGVGWKAT
jgi:hypothetical protein